MIFELGGGSKIGVCCSCTFTKLFLRILLSLPWLLMLLFSLFINNCAGVEDDGNAPVATVRALVAIVGTIFGEFPTAPLLIFAKLFMILKLFSGIPVDGASSLELLVLSLDWFCTTFPCCTDDNVIPVVAGS